MESDATLDFVGLARTGDVAQIVRRGDQEERLANVQAIGISVVELAATGTRLTPNLLRILQTPQLHESTVPCPRECLPHFMPPLWGSYLALYAPTF